MTDEEKGVQCYIDSYFAGSWDKTYSDNAETFFFCTGCVITYVGCLVLWCSKLHTEIDLSETEA